MNDSVQSPQAPENARDHSPSAGIDTADVAASVDAKVVEVSTTGAASEVLGGMEGSEVKEKSESVSDKKRDPTPQNKQSSSGQGDDHAAQVRAGLQNTSAQVTHKVMVRKVKHALHHEMRQMKKLVKKYKRNALKYAKELADAFGALRHLRNLLKSVATMAVEMVQMIYQKVLKKESLATVEY